MFSTSENTQYKGGMSKISFKAATLPKTINFLPHIAINANMKANGWSDWAFEIGWLCWYVGFRVNNN